MDNTNTMLNLLMVKYTEEIEKTNTLLSKNRGVLANKLTPADALALIICRQKENKVLREIIGKEREAGQSA